MGLTKAKIADLISEIKHGGDAPSTPKFHPTVIYEVADIVRNQILKMAYFDARNSGSKSLPGEFYKGFYNNKVKKCNATDREYVELPAKIVTLPNSYSILSVSPMKETHRTFDIVEAGSDSVYTYLDVEYFGNTEVYVEGDRLYVKNLPTGVEDLFMRMIPSTDNLKSDDPYPIPATMEADFINMVSQMLNEQKETIQDNYNDSNAK